MAPETRSGTNLMVATRTLVPRLALRSHRARGDTPSARYFKARIVCPWRMAMGYMYARVVPPRAAVGTVPVGTDSAIERHTVPDATLLSQPSVKMKPIAEPLPIPTL